MTAPFPTDDAPRSLYRENQALRGLLRDLGRDAAHNQLAMQRFQERELALLCASDLVRLLVCMTRGMRDSFELDSVKLKLLDPCGVMHDLMVGHPDTDKELLRDIELCTDISCARARFDAPDEPWLGEWDEDRHRPLFQRRLNGSVALLPLRHAEGTVGFLCLGSRDATRFTRGQATDFLDHLARVAAACLENAVNRERLRLAGLTDSLTGLYNRRHLEHRLVQEVTRAQRHGQTLSCLFVDTDRFKRINDEHGHPAGDQVLTTLAQRLRGRLRASDLATRFGGDEFVVLLPQTDLGSAELLAWEICRAVADEPVTLSNGDDQYMTVSIGVSSLPDSDHRPAAQAGEAMLNAADEAAYRAKSGGRDRVACCSPSID